jgi:glycyl-tRNA synthetase
MNDLSKIISLAKRRGFVYPSSEIYGGLANTYDYGPLGIELLLNIKKLWWQNFVEKRPEIIGLDTSILMSPKVWQASGHTKSFNDIFIDCKKCKLRTRADHLIEEKIGKKAEGLSLKEIDKIIKEKKINCPQCNSFNWTNARYFNLLFETKIGILPEKQSLTYLRGEIAQGMFVNFKNIIDSFRILNPELEPGLPFGLAQIGKAFRNEITKGNFIFRTLEFNLAEIEYFFEPEKQNWRNLFEEWKKEIEKWTIEILGLSKKNLKWRVHTKNERAHYSRHTEDLDYKFPFGFKELYGLAYRTDYDLKNHMKESGQDLNFIDPKTGRKFIPHVIEPTFGLDRTFLALLCEGYFEDKERVILKLKPKLAPFKIAVFPLLANKPKLVKKALYVFELLKNHFSVLWDARGNIGKRYYSQDEIGTIYGITIDYQTLKDDTVTIRDRDSKKQTREKITKLIDVLKKRLEI